MATATADPRGQLHPQEWLPLSTASNELTGSLPLHPLGLSTLKQNGELVSNPIDTCGYISGNPQYPITCHLSETCALDAEYGIVACCDRVTKSWCSASTRCLDRTQSDLENQFEQRDLICDDERAPLCKTDVLADGQWKGYSLFMCDTDKIGETIFAHTTTTDVRITMTGSEGLTTVSASASRTQERKPAESSATAEHDEGSSSRIGVIVGSVLGSIGGIAALVVGFLLIREIMKKKDECPTPGQSENDTYADEEGADAPEAYRLDSLEQRHTAPSEMPDSPNTVGARSELPVSPVSPSSGMDGDGHESMLEGNDWRLHGIREVQGDD